MTKDEFLDRFVERSGMSKACRTPDGIKDGHFERIAEPCNCGEYQCSGWQLVKPAKTNVTVRAGAPEIVVSKALRNAKTVGNAVAFTIQTMDADSFRAFFKRPENIRALQHSLHGIKGPAPGAGR